MSQPSQEQIINAFKSKTSELEALGRKIETLTSERDEADHVATKLKQLPADRTASRMVGDLLITSTVAEVLTSVQGTRDALDAAIASLSEHQVKQQAALASFKAQYNIRVRQ
eukprot:CAMPEP_0170744772 /NCGR_PEP_ID=MMETSP0437-20130122/7955_1 /TAXON_ID=0 /ORGANISM="Sexangularia sp." /LENGTH=111 /DNA_ID=CAMNT_0011083481 /DNA_START=25 /DNA_END=360 /DNA_ORIENTATION=-